MRSVNRAAAAQINTGEIAGIVSDSFGGFPPGVTVTAGIVVDQSQTGKAVFSPGVARRCLEC